MTTRNEDPIPGVSAKADEITYSTEKISSGQSGHQTVITETVKKKKKRYSRNLRGVQGLERGIARSLETVSEGVARMYKVYNKEREKSARKKKDGALRDGLENWAKAMSKGLRVAGDAPYNFVKAVNKGGGSKQVRKTIRILTPPPLR